jgi:hypothetical protein
VKGNNQNTFSVTLPSQAVSINNGAMTVSNFTSTTNAQQNNTSVINIAATLNTNGTKVAGNYNAQDPFQVTLNYN